MKRKITTILALLLVSFFLCAGQAFAIGKTLRVGNGDEEGGHGDVVSLPITLNNPSNVGGAAFTLSYDEDVFKFVGLEQVTPPISDGTTFEVPEGDITDNQTYYNPYFKQDPYADAEYGLIVPDTRPYTPTNPPAPALFFQSNDRKDELGNPIGQVSIAAASATALNTNTLFNAKFKILSGQGEYPIGLSRTIVHNPAAGYPTPEAIPALCGMPESDPLGIVLLASGSITVNFVGGYTISGSVTYEGGDPANGSVVVLSKQGALGKYFFNSQTTVADGSYSFTDKSNGNYRVCVTPPTNSDFYKNCVDVTVNGANATADVVLPSPTTVSGNVTINSKYIPGLRVKVVNADGVTVGIFAVNEDGSYSSGALPPGTYTAKAVYGSLESDALTNNYDWIVILRTISGTVSGLSEGDVATVEAGSVKGKLRKTVLSDLASDEGIATYTIPNLVPADDYIVSANADGKPVIYYDGKSSMSEADKVDISAADMNEVLFDYGDREQGTICGKVIENENNVTGIEVFAFGNNSLTSVVTDSLGYCFDLALGAYEVFVIKGAGKLFYYADGGTTRNQSDATILSVEEGSELGNININITECNETLTGKVTYKRPDGDPVVGAMMTAKDANGVTIDFTTTGKKGFYTLSGLCIGTTYTVSMYPRGGFGVQTEDIIITDGDNTKDFIIDIGNTLSGQITESVTANPVPGAMIHLIDEITGKLVGGRIYFSNAEGNYSISDIPNGVYTLRVLHSLYRTYTAKNLGIDEDTVKNVPLVKGANFNGKVTDASNGNASLQGALIIVTSQGSSPVYALTNSAGKYAVHGLDEATKYIIMAQKRGYERQVEVNQTPAIDTGTEVNFALAHPSETFELSGVITTDADGNPPVINAFVMVSSKSKKFLARTKTDSNGKYSFSDLPQSDDYRFIVVSEGGLLRPYVDSPMTITTGSIISGTATKDVVIPCGSEISGIVTWSGGGKAYVFLYTEGNKFVDYTAVNASGGTYTFTGLTGNYKLLAYVDETKYEWYEDQITIDNATLVTADSSDINIDLTD